MKVGRTGAVAVMTAIAVAIVAGAYASRDNSAGSTGKESGDIVVVSVPRAGPTPMADPNAGVIAVAGSGASTNSTDIGTDASQSPPDAATEAALERAGLEDRSNSRKRAIERQLHNPQIIDIDRSSGG